MYRYVEYDFVIYTHDLRHQILADYVGFFEGKSHFDFDVILFLLEELSFRILNYKLDIPDSQVHIDAVIDLIKKRLLIDKEKLSE